MAPLSDIDRLIQAPEPILRAVLLALCRDGKVLFKATQYMDQLAECVVVEPKDAAKDSGSLKRKAATELRICVRCEVFMEDDNSEDDCLYHPGERMDPFFFFPPPWPTTRFNRYRLITLPVS